MNVFFVVTQQLQKCRLCLLPAAHSRRPCALATHHRSVCTLLVLLHYTTLHLWHLQIEKLQRQKYVSKSLVLVHHFARTSSCILGMLAALTNDIKALSLCPRLSAGVQLSLQKLAFYA